MPQPPTPPTKPGTIAYGLLLLAACAWLVVEITSMPPRPEPRDDTTTPPPPSTAHAPDPPCYEVHKFCVGLHDMSEELVDNHGQPVDDDHDGRTWRMVTATLQISPISGGRESFGASSVALIDTEGGRHTNDNSRVGLEKPHATFSRTDRVPKHQTYVFLLDEAEEVHCLMVDSSRSPEEICFPADA